MRVVTPSITLDVRVDDVSVRDRLLLLDGVAGPMPCETTLKPAELRRLLRMLLKPSVLWLMLARR
jgi:hypothetical protein